MSSPVHVVAKVRVQTVLSVSIVTLMRRESDTNEEGDEYPYEADHKQCRFGAGTPVKYEDHEGVDGYRL